MKDLIQKINEDHYAAPDFDKMTPQVLILKLIEGEKLNDVLPKLANGAKMSILGVLDEHESKFKTTVKEVQDMLFPHNKK